MCGITGFLDLGERRPADREVLARMTASLRHRGPDSSGVFAEDGVALGFRRLSIIDLTGGDQPLLNEDGTLVLICNGEIYNHRELRRELAERGHLFRTRSDVEVLLHLYEEEGIDFLPRLNGQFAFALYDRRACRLLLARDPFGIAPLHYTMTRGTLIFGSEIKAILEHPLAPRRVNLTALDQVLSFPGLLNPATMFDGIFALEAGHLLVAGGGTVHLRQYWDLDYPRQDEIAYDQPESSYVEALLELFARAVERRLQADVPVGLFVSGGMDSAMVAAMARRLTPDVARHSFSIAFTDPEICEARYQRLVAAQIQSLHHELLFDWSRIADRLTDMVGRCECPVKESFNTCTLALAESARSAGIRVVLAGEGADELFAGYMGYRFDEFGPRRRSGGALDELLEEEVRERLWGDPMLFYERDHHALSEANRELYSPRLNEIFPSFSCLERRVVDPERLRGRHPLHQRSYLDVKLRLAEHLLSEHGDRMVMANSVEARYPFLDKDLVAFATRLPPDLKLKGFVEKYILRRAAEGLIPAAILAREKFGFRAPGTPYLLRQRIAWIEDMLSYERIKRQGYFDPAVVERLKQSYRQEGFTLNPHLDTDLLMVVLTFNILTDLFSLPDLDRSDWSGAGVAGAWQAPRKAGSM